MSRYGQHDGAVATLSTTPTPAAPSEPYVANVQANYVGQIAGVGTPATIPSYAPPDASDKVLIVFCTSRNAGTLGSTLKTFAGNNLVFVGSESGTGSGNAARIMDQALGDGAETPGDILVSFVITGSTGTDRVLMIALTGINLAQAGAEASGSSGGSLADLNDGDNLDVTFTGHTVGALLVSFVFRHSGSNGTRGPSVKAGYPQTELLTTASTGGADIYCTVGVSIAGTTDPIVHRYEVEDDGTHGYQWGSWAVAP